MPRNPLAERRLYLVCDATPSLEGVEAALRGGVDILQLRDRTLADGDLLARARELRVLAHRYDALFFVNDRVDIALLAGADGVHVGQDDIAPGELRRLAGRDLLIGISTHSKGQIAAARDVDYLSVGPVYATPTKPGRASVGHELVRHAASHVALPWFAIGGIDLQTAPAVAAAGATRFAIVRAIAQAEQPGAIAAQLVDLLARTSPASIRLAPQRDTGESLARG